MEINSKKDLTGKQKAAILLMTLDADVSAKIFRELEMKEVEQIAVEITNLHDVPPHIVEAVIEEFYQLMTATGYMLEGGLEYAQVLLEKTYGSEMARTIIEKIRVLTTVKGFSVLKKSDPQLTANFLSKEHPQTIALILSYLPPDITADILTEFDDNKRSDVIIRIATLGKVSPAVVSEIENVVNKIAETNLSQSLQKSGGAQLVASILNKTNTQVAKSLIETIEEKDFELASSITRLMFLFEDIITIDDKGIQRILREVDKKELVLALKMADDKVKEKIFKNMSERAALVVTEELEFMGPVKLKDVEAAQLSIVEVIKDLEDKEEIFLSGRGDDNVFV